MLKITKEELERKVQCKEDIMKEKMEEVMSTGLAGVGGCKEVGRRRGRFAY